MTNNEVHDLADKYVDGYRHDGNDLIGYEFSLDSYEKLVDAIAQRTRDECAEMILRTDLQALPDDWKNPAASFLLAYAESIRSMK